MRNITKQSIDAFNECKSFKKQNMEVKIEATENGIPCLLGLYLYGNKIAEKHTNERGEKIYITTCGWNTVTTKERLNGIEGVDIHQKNGQFYLNGEMWTGEMTLIKNETNN